MHHKIHQTICERHGVIVPHTENNPTVLRGQCKQFPIPKEKRGTKKEHEDLFSVKFAVWILRGVQTLVTARPMKTGVLTYSWLKKKQWTEWYCTIWSKWIAIVRAANDTVREREREREKKMCGWETKWERGKWSKEGNRIMPIKGKESAPLWDSLPNCHSDQTVVVICEQHRQFDMDSQTPKQEKWDKRCQLSCRNI